MELGILARLCSHCRHDLRAANRPSRVLELHSSDSALIRWDEAILMRAPDVCAIFSSRMSLIFTLWFLIIGCAVFAALGIVILASVPFFRVTFLNLLVFVVVAIPGAVISLLVLANLFLRNQPIGSPSYGFFAILMGGGVSVGALAVWLKMRIASALRIDSSR